MKPDLVIYLQAETGKLMRNIKNRGRKFEVSISREYIESLNQVYNQFFMRYNETPLMIVNVTDIDFVNNSEDLEDLMDNIRKPFTGTKFYNPAEKSAVIRFLQIVIIFLVARIAFRAVRMFFSNVRITKSDAELHQKRQKKSQSFRKDDISDANFEDCE